MSDLYSEQHRELQEQHGTRQLADRLEQIIVEPRINTPGFLHREPVDE